MKKTILTIIGCAVVGGLSGYEMFLASQAVRKFPPPGRLVDIDGRKLQIDCRGRGSPTVVLESGGHGIFGPLEWGAVLDEIAESSRVCSYSRAGYMWSDSRRSLDDEGGARDLHTALRLANEQPPFVMVSHSRGAYNNLIFTDLFSNDVAALVFVDPSHPELVARKSRAGVKQTELPLASVKILRALRWTGLPRAFAGYCSLDYLPAQDIEACKAWFPHSLDGIISENEVYDSVAARAAKVRGLGERPVLVLTRQWNDEWYSADAAVRAAQKKEEKLWQELNAEIASLSSHGEQRFVPDSYHASLVTHPRAMIAGIREIVEHIRQPSL